MRFLVWITAICAALYAGYWVVGSRAVLQGAESALAEMKAGGRADYSAVSLQGFPSRFDLTIEAPQLVSADGYSQWQADFLQLLALSYRPNHLMAIFPPRQTLRAGYEEIALANSDLRASIALAASTDLALDHAEVEGHDLDLSSNFGWQLLAEKLVLASRRADGSGTTHEIALKVTGLAPGDQFRQLIDPQHRHPSVASTASAGMIASFDAPLDRRLAEAPVRLRALRDIGVTLSWGTMQLTASGAVEIDSAGLPVGRIDLVGDDWRAIFALLRDGGVFDPQLAPGFENGLAEIAKADGTPDQLKLPLIFENGGVWLGPLPLGPAPRF
ncbi:MAG: DUF2125 domain-containing protein [Paracoccaceae bacterium]